MERQHVDGGRDVVELSSPRAPRSRISRSTTGNGSEAVRRRKVHGDQRRRRGIHRELQRHDVGAARIRPRLHSTYPYADVGDLEVYDDGSGPQLYIGGSFTIAGGVAVSNVTRWNGTTFDSMNGGVGVGAATPTGR